LDAALLRPGRFDRKIEVMLPDLDGRKKILSVHSLSKPLSSEVDLGYWASRTVGFSGADLANLMNESAIHCARDESKLISDLHIENALDKITIGLRSSLITSPNMKKIIAYNEVGRAIVSAVRNGIESVDKITILPRSGSIGGYTILSPDEDVISSGLISKKFLFSKIEIALAGRAAETIVFGEGEITQCSINDISYATNIVREMVTKYGFSIIGPISMDSDNNEMYLGDGLFKRKPFIAENTSSRIDNEIIKISKISLNNSIVILKKNRVLLDKNSEQFTFRWVKNYGPIILRENNNNKLEDELVTEYLQSGIESSQFSFKENNFSKTFNSFTKFFVLGIQHIIPKGLDHILFIFGLFLFSSSLKKLISQITIFTIAHSITLIFVSLSLMSINPQIVEPIIALSIVYIGFENIFKKSWSCCISIAIRENS